MSSYDTWLNVLTGISQGSFDKIYLRDASGNMVDLLTIIGLGGGGGGGGTVTSATAPLAIDSNGVLSISLAGYATNAAVNSLLANYNLTSSLFSGVSVGTGLVALTGSGTLSLGLTGLESRTALKLADSQGTIRDLTASQTGALV